MEFIRVPCSFVLVHNLNCALCSCSQLHQIQYFNISNYLPRINAVRRVRYVVYKWSQFLALRNGWYQLVDFVDCTAKMEECRIGQEHFINSMIEMVNWIDNLSSASFSWIYLLTIVPAKYSFAECPGIKRTHILIWQYNTIQYKTEDGICFTDFSISKHLSSIQSFACPFKCESPFWLYVYSCISYIYISVYTVYKL